MNICTFIQRGCGQTNKKPPQRQCFNVACNFKTIMRTLIFIFLVTVIQLTASGQNISYNIPSGYEKDISKEDYKTLVDLSVPFVSKRYAIDKVADGTIQLTSGQEMRALNLHNLIVKCAAVKDKSKWIEIVQGHFDNLFSTIDEQKKINPENYETVKKYLSLRIYTSQAVNQRGGVDNLVVHSDLDGTYTLLMLDLPGGFAAVQRPMFALWKKDMAEVFKVAQANINKQTVDKVTQQFEIDGAKIEISFLGDEDYAASYALDLGHNAPELVGEWGSIVAIPNKGLVDICKVSRDKPLDFVKFIQRTKPLIEKSFREHPQPISEEYFWYYKGTFTKVMVLSQPNGNINVISPTGLTELMTETK